ncbi:MAG: type II toxin-antitoxin system prevent-host-death family antitoxin [Gemmataceae bacterium]|nr:type II toxin-antitoxin system prevent-host-death family antitoxin [Gemmataceae bacterium]
MTSVGSYEAKTHLPELLERVEHGENILITRRGTPVALLTQPPQKSGRDVRQVVEDMLAYRNRQNRTTGDLSIRQMIEQGRKS